MSQEEKRNYWHNIEDAFMTKQETSWTRSTMLRKLARHVTDMQPAAKEPTNKAAKQEVEREMERKHDHPASNEVGKIITLKRRNHLQEFHDHMMKHLKTGHQTAGHRQLFQ